MYGDNMKKIKIYTEEFVKPVINYMLREYDADYESVKKTPEIKGTPWFQYYWDTPETKLEFITWLEDFIKTQCSYKPHKPKDIISAIDLMWGLKVYANED